MKTTFLVLLGMALLAIPGAAAAATAAPACLVRDSGAAEGALHGIPLHGEDPENAAMPAPAPMCPEFRPCSGSDCFGTSTCSFTDTNKRCCYDSSLTQHCCPAGQTVFAVVCACGGTSCTTATMQTALCF
jgi:hypothetical protein